MSVIPNVIHHNFPWDIFQMGTHCFCLLFSTSGLQEAVAAIAKWFIYNTVYFLSESTQELTFKKKRKR